MIQKYLRILSSAWFERVWVVQEHALSRRAPCALLGSALFSFDALWEFQPDLTALETSTDDKAWVEAVNRKIDSAKRERFGAQYMRTLIRSNDFRAQAPARQLWQVLRNLRPKAATVPHDAIYGLLGLVDLTTVPGAPTPDYRCPYGDVSRAYTSFLLERNCDLSLLTLSELRVLDGQPSWVVDFRDARVEMCRPATRHAGRLVATDRNALVLSGAREQTVVASFSGRGADADAGLGDFYHSVLARAAAIRQRPLAEVWSEWLADYLGSCHEPPAAAPYYRGVGDFLSAGFVQGEHVTFGAEGLNSGMVLTFFGRTQFALLDNGIVVHGRARDGRSAAGPLEVWALLGSARRWIVEQAAEREGCYRYIGWLDEADDLLVEEYFSRRRIEEITLI